MIYEDDKKELKRYRHLIACLIDYSIGYFTPLAALRAIQAHRKKEPYYCELYMDTYYKNKKRENANLNKYDLETEKKDYRQINKDYIKDSLRYFKLSSHTHCLRIVDYNINGRESIGASWF